MTHADSTAPAPLVVKGPWFDVPAGAVAARCRSCSATVYWIRTAAGNRMPVDCEVEGGCTPWPGDSAVEAADGRGISHFATCPQSNTWRQRG